LVDQQTFTGLGTLEANLTGSAWHPLVIEASSSGIRLEEIAF
jgi:hypothetical protein